MNENMIVQWFPGHMAKTRRLIKESLSMVDAVCEIVDARIPESSRNPELDEIVGSKPRIVLLNKCDLADPNATARKIKELAQKGVTALPVDCRSGKGLEKFQPAVREVLKEKIKANTEKGMAGKSLRVMVVGIPNTGKSSFINRMAGKNRAKVADKPGVTRSNQWFNSGSGIELLDTPGVLWPKFDDPQVGRYLAYTGAVKDAILDPETLCIELIGMLRDISPAAFIQRYNLATLDGLTPEEILEAVARRRGMLISGGEADTERAAITIIDEFRAAKLGRVTLELPPEVE